MHLANGAQILNITTLFLSSARLAAESSPALVTVIVQVCIVVKYCSSMYGSV